MTVFWSQNLSAAVAYGKKQFLKNEKFSKLILGVKELPKMTSFGGFLGNFLYFDNVKKIDFVFWATGNAAAAAAEYRFGTEYTLYKFLYG